MDDEGAWLAERFEQYRGRLKAVAYRMLGSPSEADDAVQEAWLRFSRTDTADVANLGSWLTTVVSRVCLNMIQSRRARPETSMAADEFDPAALADGDAGLDPEQEALLADSVGLALLVVLDTLAPAERVALILHDVFGVPFEEIAPVVGRNAAATRQLASRARRRVREPGADDVYDGADRLRQARVVDAFLSASRKGDFEALLTVLDPDVMLRADETAVKLGARSEVHGATRILSFAKRAHGAIAALVDGVPGAAWVVGSKPRIVFRFTTADDRIVGIELVGDPDALGRIDLVLAERPRPVHGGGGRTSPA
jgi:RNA polymerase sigma factor (sigma-70 family)